MVNQSMHQDRETLNASEGNLLLARESLEPIRYFCIDTVLQLVGLSSPLNPSVSQLHPIFADWGNVCLEMR